MLDYYKMRLCQVLDTIKISGFSHLLNEIIFVNREAIPVEKDLSVLKPLGNSMLDAGNEIIEIAPEALDKRALVYPATNRYLKALHYMKSGYGGYALVSCGKIVGDIWYASLNGPGDDSVHPDIKWLGIRHASKEVYAFDMYLDHQERGKNLAPLLMNGALHEFQKKGFTKAYGFFWANNIPALWVHRTLKWKELPKVKVSRFLFLKKTMKKETITEKEN
jgi:GNAT superfamily N-acetyltransferase